MGNRTQTLRWSSSFPGRQSVPYPQIIPLRPYPSDHTPQTIPLRPHLSHCTPQTVPLRPYPSDRTPHTAPLRPYPSDRTPQTIPLRPHPSHYTPQNVPLRPYPSDPLLRDGAGTKGVMLLPFSQQALLHKNTPFPNKMLL